MRRLLFLAALAAAIPAAGQVPRDPFEFRVPSNVEGFVGSTTTVTVRFSLYFPVDDTRYLPVDAELAEILSGPPRIAAPDGIETRVVSSVCTPAAMTIRKPASFVDVIGGEIETTIEITPRTAAADLDHTIAIQYLVVEALFIMLKAEAPARPETELRMHVWPSVAAKEAFLRLEEEKRLQRARTEEQARLAELERVRREKEAAAEARRAARARMFRAAQPYAVAVLLLALLGVLYRGWFAPDVEVTVTSGGHVQQTLPGARNTSAEPGTITETVWARSLLGRRQRIKVETFVTDAEAGPDAHGVDLLVSVGASVAYGQYVAACRKGAVKVIVAPA